MSAELLKDNSIRITEYDLPSFVFAIAEHAMKGFVPTMSNGLHPEGGYGSYYSCVLVPINQPRYGLKGEKINFPEEALQTSTETAQTSDSSGVKGVGNTNVPETPKDVVDEPTEGSSKTDEPTEVSEVSTSIKTPTKRGAKK